MLPAMRGVIDRRLLVNFRVDPSPLAAALPDPFEPKTVDGYGVGGICLIRLRDVRPRGVPAALGVGSENAAHRIAVTWEDGGTTREGVYVPRRDSDSRLNTVLGERVFAGRYRPATFDVDEDPRAGRYAVGMLSRDGEAGVRVVGEVADDLPDGSVFDSLTAASAFFESGSLGYSPGDDGYEGIELVTDEWTVEPLAVEVAASSYFEDRDRFPADAVTFDCALLMRDVDHEWRQRESICAPAPAAAAE